LPYLVGHSGAVNSLSLSEDKQTLISGSWDATAKIWNMNTLECIKTLEGHKFATTVCRMQNG
jgi:phospholipase A-2-activating protein